MKRPLVKIHLLPGGIMPKRKTRGAACYDIYIRAVVSSTEQDPENPLLRKTEFDFKEMPRGRLRRLIGECPDGELYYRLNPGKSVLCGIGFATAMPPGICYEIKSRSGLKTRQEISVVNADTIVDSDFRGEPGILTKNIGRKPFLLKHGSRVAQIHFKEALFPDFTKANKHSDLSRTRRGGGGFGSTGLR